MPVYEYVCLACEEHFDRLQPMAAPDPDCPSCGQDRVRRQPSMIAGLTGTASQGAGGAPPGGGCACGGACACRR
jgi:putative FmdB family regulatory protein